MRYKEVHLEHAQPHSELDAHTTEAIKEVTKYGTLYHIGALSGKTIAAYHKDTGNDVGGCEEYPLASSYAKKAYSLCVTAYSNEVADKSHDVVLLDTDYSLNIEEALRIASKAVLVKGVGKLDNIDCPELNECDRCVINDTYELFMLEAENEYSDFDEG